MLSPRKIKQEEDIHTIIQWLCMMPLLSLPELSAVSGLAYDRCNRLMRVLFSRGQVDSVYLGMTLKPRRRWFLTTTGADFAVNQVGCSIEWPMSQAGLRLLIQRLPMLEGCYGLVCRLWSLPSVRAVAPIYRTEDPDEKPITFPAHLAPVRFQWQRDADIHAIIEYSSGAWITWTWAGAMTTRTVLQRKLTRGRDTLMKRADPGQPCSPAAWVVVGADRPAAYWAASCWRDDNVLALTVQGEALRPMWPSDFSRPLFEDAGTDDLGNPETIVEWVENDPVASALNGRLNYQLYQCVAQWPGARIGQLHERFTHSHDEVNAALRSIQDRGLVVRLEWAFYLTRPGMLAAAHMDRISHQSIYGSFDQYLSPDGAYRRSRRPHDRAVIEFILSYDPEETWIGHGRRFVVNLADKTQIAPDAVGAHFNDDGSVDLAVFEVELTSKSRSAARRKLRPHRRLHQQSGRLLLIGVVVGTEVAEEAFLAEGRGLQLFTTTLQRIRKPESDVDIWRQP